ncbi:MAG: hypothetical protein AB7I18_01580 [Candidatus Berkiella sp.]
MRSSILKIISILLIALLSFSVIAKSVDKQELARNVSKVLEDSDKESFQVILKPIVNNYDISTIKLTNEERLEFKKELSTALSKYLLNILLETRMEIFDENELRALTAHYGSPTGKSIAKKLPLIRELQNIESLDTASKQILTAKELAYAKKFSDSEIGKSISIKTKQVNQAVWTKVNSNNALEKIATQFSQDYFHKKGQKLAN